MPHRRSITTLAAGVAVCLAALSASVFAGNDAEFFPLGALPASGGGSFHAIVARSVTPTGSHVVGQAKGSLPGYRWNQDQGILDELEAPPIKMTNAFGISYDGMTVAGVCNTPNSIAEACFWREGEGFTQLGILSGTFFSSSSFGVSGDGQTVVGWARSTDAGPSDFAAFKWTEDEGMVHLGYLGGGTFSQALGVSYDGSVIAGVARTADSVHFAFRWTEDQGMINLGDLPGPITNSGGRAISGDGSTIVGNAFSMNGQEAFRWTEDEGMMPLGILSVIQGAGGPGFEHTSMATGANFDGSVIVGVSTSIGDPTVNSEAFIWDEVNGMRRLKEVLETEYMLDLTGYAIVSAGDVHTHDDGTIAAIAGLTIGPGGIIEAFIVRASGDVSTCPGDLTSSGSVGVPDLLQLLSSWGPCPQAPDPSGQCAGFCGNVAPAGCWCDEFCDDVGDCCDDVCDGCPELPHCPGGGAPPCPADLTGNGSVGVPDLLQLLASWGPCP